MREKIDVKLNECMQRTPEIRGVFFRHSEETETDFMCLVIHLVIGYQSWVAFLFSHASEVDVKRLDWKEERGVNKKTIMGAAAYQLGNISSRTITEVKQS